MKKIYTNTCSAAGCKPAEFDNPNEAISEAHTHSDLGKEHVVTTTRPAQNHPGSIPVIVAITNPEMRPRTTVYTTDMERYQMGVRK